MISDNHIKRKFPENDIHNLLMANNVFDLSMEEQIMILDTCINILDTCINKIREARKLMREERDIFLFFFNRSDFPSL